MLSSRYELEFVVTSHDKEVRSISFDTDIAETLLVARRLRENETQTGRGLFVNLWHAPRRETDALALVKGVSADGIFSSAPLGRATCWRHPADNWRRAVGRIGRWPIRGITVGDC